MAAVSRQDQAPDRAAAIRASAPNDTLLVEAVLESLSAMVVVLDRTGRIVRINAAAARMIALPSVDVRGRFYWELFKNAGQPEQVRAQVKRMLEGDLPAEPEEVFIRHRGEQRTVNWSATALRDSAGLVEYLVLNGTDDTERKHSERALQDAERRLRNQNATLVELTRNTSLGHGDLTGALQAISEAAARTLHVEQVNIWLFNPDRTGIHCIDNYSTTLNDHSAGQALRAQDYPSYFRAIEANRTLGVAIAQEDPCTAELVDSYLRPAGITSLLDAPIRLGGRMEGVVCHEHVGPPRQWTVEEENFAGSIADLVALAIEATERQRAENELRIAHDELESRVKERTQELSRAYEELKREVAERNRAEAELGKQTGITTSVLDSISDGVVVCDERGRLLVFNPAAKQILRRGPSKNEPTNWAAEFGLYRSDRVTLMSVDELPLVRALQGEEVDDVEIFVRHDRLPEGIWLNVSARPLKQTQGAVAVIRDITERRRSQQRILAEQKRTRQMLAAHERDRQLIAYEIHDGMVQDVTGAIMHFEAFRQKQPPQGEAARFDYDTGLGLLREMIGEARHLISGLRPPILDEQGLVAAIGYLVNEHRVRCKRKIQFVHDVDFEHLEPLLEGTLFRVAQEALTNVERHSQSKRARVTLRQLDHRLRLEIRDWGIGFDPNAVVEHRYGIYGIRERARLLKGKASILSAPGKGTKVRVELPLSHARPGAGYRSTE